MDRPDQCLALLPSEPKAERIATLVVGFFATVLCFLSDIVAVVTFVC
ncbi:MAG: hypothetical protein JWP40_1858 [Blastococcus sp.]|jgi:hypothetical protein|nr:hypothetical protein [Blastococcus sp.]